MSYTLRPIVKWQPDFHEAIIVLWQPFADHTNVIQTDSVGLYNFMPVLDLKCHLQDENVNEIFARPVLQDLEERFRNYLDPSIKEFDPRPDLRASLLPLNHRLYLLLKWKMFWRLPSAKLWLVKEVSASANR